MERRDEARHDGRDACKAEHPPRCLGVTRTPQGPKGWAFDAAQGLELGGQPSVCTHTGSAAAVLLSTISDAAKGEGVIASGFTRGPDLLVDGYASEASKLGVAARPRLLRACLH